MWGSIRNGLSTSIGKTLMKSEDPAEKYFRWQILAHAGTALQSLGCAIMIFVFMTLLVGCGVILMTMD
jgi:hypothetical protein